MVPLRCVAPNAFYVRIVFVSRVQWRRFPRARWLAYVLRGFFCERDC